MAAGFHECVQNGAFFERLRGGVAASLKRRSVHEPTIAGLCRVWSQVSENVRDLLADCSTHLLQKRAWDRPLLLSAMHSLAACQDERVLPTIQHLLDERTYTSLAAYSVAGTLKHSDLRKVLERNAVSRPTHLAFASELARVLRGEAQSRRLAEMAAKIKEYHRISLCASMFVPLEFAHCVQPELVPTLRIFCDVERNLGRWLVFAQIAHRSGEVAVIEEAKHRKNQATSNNRVVWSLVNWVLEHDAVLDVRPSMTALARLSDRPVQERDLLILFRLAEQRVRVAKDVLLRLAAPVLHALACDPVALRAVAALAIHYQHESCLTRLKELVFDQSCSCRGLAAALLYDSGETEMALQITNTMNEEPNWEQFAWACLVQVNSAFPRSTPIVNELTFRRLNRGWLD
jgi:hypothetical protein